MAPRIEIHEIAARDLRVGDQLSRNGAAGLDNWYDTDDAGQDVTITSVQVTNYGEHVEITFSDDYYPQTTRADIRVTVTRPWSPSR